MLQSTSRFQRYNGNMNTGDTICELQNQKKSLGLLAAQRQLYSEAKTLGALSTFVCLGVPLIITLSQIALGGEILSYGLLWIISLICCALGVILQAITGRKIDTAAAVQQNLDSYLFGTEFPNPDFSVLPTKRAEKRYLRKGCSFDCLRNWYTPAIKGLDAMSAIASCQKENVSWSLRLFRRYFFFCIGVVALALMLITFLVITASVPIENLFFFIPMVEWLLAILFAGISSYYSLSRTSASAHDFNLATEENVERMQTSVMKLRRMKLTVPDWFYGIFKDKDELSSSEEIDYSKMG